MLCSERPRFLLIFFGIDGRLYCRAVHIGVFSPLPFAEDGVAVEPRPVAAAPTSFRFEPPPRRSLRRDREARELIALSKLFQDTRRLQRQVRDARRLQLLIALVAAVRRAGLVG
jgi:hypothetical protein